MSHAERQTETAGERVAVDAGDGRLAERPHFLEQLGQAAATLVELEKAGAVGHVAEIGSGAERLVACTR